MGLHPPSGTDGDLDDKFINKALEFKPKLLIIIAHRGTQRYVLKFGPFHHKTKQRTKSEPKTTCVLFPSFRLDSEDFPYDLIWEDDKMFIFNVSAYFRCFEVPLHPTLDFISGDP